MRYARENIIFKYSRDDALNDGTFNDISDIATEAGFNVPVAITCGVKGLLNEKINIKTNDPLKKQDFNWRAWDMFTILKHTIATSKPDTFIEFTPEFIREKTQKPEQVKLWAMMEDSGDGTPAITIMLPEEY
mgnify:CR=1 FL=1|jgi:hypothetical protein|tara:strand:- start:490 stop:885 length:396 start_codon:yes stop_codon:yes gene_type:complete